MRLELDLPFRIESLNRGQRLTVKNLAAVRRQRFAARGKVKLQRNGTHLLLKAKLPGQLRARLLREGEGLVITLTRLGPGLLDDDNLAAGTKALRDGISDALDVRDNHPRLRWLYGQTRTGRGVYGCRVLFETMSKSELGARLAAEEEARA